MTWYKSWLDSIYIKHGFIAHLANEAIMLGMQGAFKESLELHKLGIAFEFKLDDDVPEENRTAYLAMLCNSLYFLQKDNTGLPVNHELNRYFLQKCLQYGQENPAIYFNAACLYVEMKDYDNVLTCIDLAKKHYKDYEMMINAVKTENLFSEFRSKCDYH